jgi:C4-dicarboxylate-specific signal transduction histidine kinase
MTEAQQILVGTGAKPLQFQVEEALARVYEVEGDFEGALAHFRRFHALKEEVYNEQSSTRMKNLQIQMATDGAEREAEIHRLRYIELSQAQAQLVQTERMAVVEKLVAGLAHEANTPLGVIGSNANVTHRVLDRLEVGYDKRALEFLRQAQRGTAERLKK